MEIEKEGSDLKPGQGGVSSRLTSSYVDRREIVKYDHHMNTGHVNSKITAQDSVPSK